MPIWNPQIEATGLADLAVDTRVLADGAVDTTKIKNLAVTDAEIANATITKLKIGDQEVDIQRMLSPVDGSTGGDFEVNVSLTTTMTSHVSLDISVPSWAGEARVWAVGWGQMTNTSGARQGLKLRCVVDGVPSTGATQQDIADNFIGQGSDYEQANVTSPGSTITCETFAATSTSTNSANNIFIRYFAMFFR
jgi:hypothetical protein